MVRLNKNIFIFVILFLILFSSCNFVFGTITYNYYREEGNTTAIHIKGNWSTSAIKVYWSNTSGTYAQNPKAVSDFYDPFNSLSLNSTLWSSTGSCLTYSASNVTYDNTASTCYLYSKKKFNTSQILYFQVKNTLASGYVTELSFSANLTDSYTYKKGLTIFNAVKGYKFCTYSSSGGTSCSSTITQDTSYHNYKIIWNTTRFVAYKDNVLNLSTGTNLDTANNEYLFLGAHFNPGATHSQSVYNYVSVEKYSPKIVTSCDSVNKYCNISTSSGNLTDYQVVINVRTTSGNLNVYSGNVNYSITAVSNSDNSTINSFSVKLQNGTSIKNYYTSTGLIMKVLATDKKKYNVTFYNMTYNFNKTYSNYNFSASGNLQGSLFRNYIYLSVNETYLNTTISRFNISVSGLSPQLNVNRTSKILMKTNTSNNFTVYGNQFLNKSVVGISTYFNKKLYVIQTNITLYVKFNSSGYLLNFTNLTIKDLNNTKYFYTNTGILHFYPSARTLQFNFKDDNFLFITKNVTFSFTAKSKTNYTIFVNETQSRLRFIDKVTTLPISNGYVTLYYPGNLTYFTSNTDTNGYFKFRLNYNGSFRTGSYYVLFSKSNYSNLNFTFFINGSYMPWNKTYNVSKSGLNITCYIQNGTRLTGTFYARVIGSNPVSSTLYTLPYGTYYLEGLPTNNYTISVYNDTYFPQTYYLNFISNRITQLKVYFPYQSKENKVFIFQNNRNIPQSDCLASFTKLINSSYVSVGQILSDSAGSGSIYLDNYQTYKIYVTCSGFLPKQYQINTIPNSIMSSNGQYIIVLLEDIQTNYTTITDLFYYNYLPLDNVFSSILGTVKINLTTISPGGHLNYWGLYLNSSLKSNVTGSVSGGVTSITLNLSVFNQSTVLPVTFFINYDANNTYYFVIPYYLSYEIPSSNSTTLNNAVESWDNLTNYSQGTYCLVGCFIITLLVLFISPIFNADSYDGSKKSNSIIIIAGICIFTVIGWFPIYLSIMIGTVLFLDLFGGGQ